MAEFSRSLAAQCAAKCIVDTAVECGVVNGPVAISPHLAESEKELIIGDASMSGDIKDATFHAFEAARYI